MSAVADLRRVLRLAGLRPGRFAVAVTLGVVASLAGIALLALSGYLICRSSQQPPILSLTVVIVVVRALAITRPLARYAERLSSHDLAFRSLGRLRATVFARVEPLAPAELEHFRDGELLSRLVRDVDELQDLVLRLLLPAAVAAAVVPVVAVGAALALPAAGALLLAGLLLAATTVPLLAHRLTVRGQARQSALRGELTAELLDALDAAPELWLHGADAEARERLAAADAALAAANRDDARGAGWADALGILLTGLTTVAVLAVASAAATGGSLDPLLVAPLALVAAAAFDVVAPLGVAGRYVGRVRAAAGRLLELDGRRPQVVDPADPAVGPARRPQVAVAGLEVRRGADRQVALRLDALDVAPGERVVVTGASGAGKSTLLAVLARFVEREHGDVTLDGTDVRDLAQDRVRVELLLSEQDPHVFASTIRENVAFARPGCDDGQILEALDRAQLGAWVRSLPDGIHTTVGERGRELSGGQRQRLAMARAFLADPSVLLVDEPTAHLDAGTARALLADLWATAGDRSVVLVTHDDPGAFAGCRRVEVVPAQPSG